MAIVLPSEFSDPVPPPDRVSSGSVFAKIEGAIAERIKLAELRSDESLLKQFSVSAQGLPADVLFIIVENSGKMSEVLDYMKVSPRRCRHLRGFQGAIKHFEETGTLVFVPTREWTRQVFAPSAQKAPND